MQTAAEYMQAHGLDAEGLAEILSVKLGKPYRAQTVQLHKNQPFPKAWAKALGVTINPDHGDAERTGTDRPSQADDGRTEPTPRPPPGTGAASGTLGGGRALPPVPGLDLTVAADRIAAIYAFAGKGVSHFTGDPVYEKAFGAYADHAGRAWAELARHDRHVATALTWLTAGGPYGEIVWVHAQLAFTILIVSGRLDGTPLVPGSVARPRKPAPSAADNGGSGAGDAVADTASTVAA